jgi:MFS family permease
VRLAPPAPGAIQSVFNLTYAISLLVTSWLADHLGAKRVFIVSNILSLVSFAVFTLAARSYESAIHRSLLGTSGNVGVGAGLLMVTLGTQIGWSPAVLGILVACMLHLFGAVATLLSGGLSDRLGRRLILVTMALAGAVLSFTFDWSADWGATVLLVLAALYGFATIADSGVLSTAMTEAVAPRHLGSMLALRSILGFGAGAFSPLAFGWVLDLTNPGLGEPTNWGWAFAALGIAGALTTLFALMLPGDRPSIGQSPRRTSKPN